METVIIAMMILVCFNYILKQTYRKPAFVVLSATVCALFVGLMWPYAIEQSKDQISRWLADSALMLDIAVVLTLEVAIQMTFCVLAAHIRSSGKVKPSIILTYRILRWFPGILIFPVLFSLLVAAIFALPGISFPLIAWSLAAVTAVAIILGRLGLKSLLPEKDIRLELIFLSNALVAVLGIIATVNGKTAVAGISDVDWIALAGIAALVIAGFLLGCIAYKFKTKKYK